MGGREDLAEQLEHVMDDVEVAGAPEHEVVGEQEVARVPAEHVLETGSSLQQVIALAGALRTPSRDASSSNRVEEEASANRLLEAVLAEFSDSDLLGEIARRLGERIQRTTPRARNTSGRSRHEA